MTKAWTWRASLIFGALVRLAVAVVATNSLDLVFFAKVAVEGAAQRPLYDNSLFSYPPLWGLLFEGIGKSLALFGVPMVAHVEAIEPYVIPGLTSADLATPLASLALKLPAMLADALLAYLILRAAGRQGASVPAARMAALGWWLNPFSIAMSSVQAGWDAIVPASLIAIVLLATEGSWYAATAVTTAGAAIKLVPLCAIFLLPSLMPQAWRPGRWFGFAAGAFAGVVVSAALILLPIGLWHEFGAMWTAIFIRTGTFKVGGANMLAFATLRQFEAVPAWIVQHRAGFLGTLGAVAFGIFTLVAALLFRVRSGALDRYWLALCAILATFCVASPLTQPTYTLWPIPFCLLLSLRGGRFWTAMAASLTVFGTLFFLSVRGVAALLVPTCAFLRGCPAVGLSQMSLAYWSASGFGGNSLQIAIDAVCGELSGLTMAACLIAALWQLATSTRSPEAPRGVGFDRPPASRLRLNAGLTLLLAVVALAPLAGAPAPIGIRTVGEGRRAVIASAGYSGSVYVTVAAASAAPIREIDAYFDKDYASLRGVTPQFAAGFVTHLDEDLARRDERIPIKAIDANALRQLLSGDPTGMCLMVLGGVLPDTVRSDRVDSFKAWLLRGGTVFWAGGPFDVMYAPRDAPTPSQAYEGPDYSKWSDLYRPGSLFPGKVNAFAPPVEHGRTQAPFWRLARIDFDRTTFPLNSGPLMRRGGAALAYIDARYNSSVSSVPLGKGRLVFFADAFNDEIHAAQVIAQLLYTSAWDRPDRLRSYAGTLKAAAAPMTIATLHGGDRVRIFGSDPDDEPFAAYDVPGQVTLRAQGERLIAGSEAYRGTVHVVLQRPPQPPPLTTVDVYADANDLGRGLFPGFRDSLVSTLRDALAVRNQTAGVRSLDADGLRELLGNPDTNAMLVVLGGVLPDVVRARGFDLLQRWLQRGGTVIWAGGPFDLLSATTSAPSFGGYAGRATVAQPDYSPWPTLYGRGSIFPSRVNVASPPVTRGLTATQLWRLWRGNFDRTTFATNTGPLLKAGGYPLGYIDARVNSSVSVIPAGRGRVVFFADAFGDPMQGAGLIAQLLFTGVWFEPARLALYEGMLAADAPPMTILGFARGDRAAAFGDGADFSPVEFLSAER